MWSRQRAAKGGYYVIISALLPFQGFPIVTTVEYVVLLDIDVKKGKRKRRGKRDGDTGNVPNIGIARFLR